MWKKREKIKERESLLTVLLNDVSREDMEKECVCACVCEREVDGDVCVC